MAQSQANVKCGGCLVIIPDKQRLTCSACNLTYDLDCANVSTQRFYNTLTAEHRRKWVCQACICKRPKTNNANTPVRQQQSFLPHRSNISNSPSNMNVTLRKKTTIPSALEDSILTASNQSIGNMVSETLENLIQNESLTDVSIVGNTLHEEELVFQDDNPDTKGAQTAIINHVSKLLNNFYKDIKSSFDTKLDDIKCELEELRLAITSNSKDEKKAQGVAEPHNLAQVDKTQQRRHEQEELKIKESITSLEIRKSELQNEIQELQKAINNPRPAADTPLNTNITSDKRKTIVLYGFEEPPQEDLNELHDRIVYAFQQILNMDLSGYIEDIQRVGKRRNRRTIMVELLSKNMTRQILHNRHCFKDTGIAVSECLNEESLQHRRKLIEILIKARREGNRANIINNKLYINGTEFKQDSTVQSTIPNKADETFETQSEYPNEEIIKQSHHEISQHQQNKQRRNIYNHNFHY